MTVMLKESLLLVAIITYVTSQQDPSGDPVNGEANAAADALANSFGFSCPKGHICRPVLDCLPCDYGTYKDENSTICQTCPPDCTTLRKGAQSREECVPFCPPGYEISLCGKTCAKCRPGTFKPTWDRHASCFECPEDSYPPEDRIGLINESQCYAEEDDPSQGTASTSRLSTITTPTSTPTSTGHLDDCPAECELPPSSEPEFCSYSVAQFITCLNDCSDDPITELFQARSSVHKDVKSKFIELLNHDQDWEYIYNGFRQQCPGTTTTDMPPMSTTPTLSPVTCDQDADCGVRGKCYGSHCGCLTTSCSGVAYAAMPGCTWFCQCDDATKSWKLQFCNTHQAFDESIDVCNHDYYVRTDICYSNVNCAVDTCYLPSSSVLCSYDVRRYMRCLRSLFVQCDRLPSSEVFNVEEHMDKQLFDALTELVAPAETVEEMKLIYNNYMTGCLEGDDPAQATTSTSGANGQTTPTTPPTSTELTEDTTTDTEATTTTDSTTSGLSSGLTEDTTTATELTTATESTPSELSSVICDQDADCGVRGKCYGSHCGCMTTSCSGVAYAAMPGCMWFCQCDDATKSWKLQFCNSHQAFDESIDVCNHDYNVRTDICYSNSTCEHDCPTPVSPDICSYGARKYMQCLRSLYIQCNRAPYTEVLNAAGQMDDQLYGDFRAWVSQVATIEQMEEVYTDYMTGCLAWISPTLSTGITPDEDDTTTVPTTGSTGSTTTIERTTTELAQVTCDQDADCGIGGECNGNHCGCLTTSCSDVAYAAMQGCTWFCHCNDATKSWELQFCNDNEAFDESIDNCNHDYNVNTAICYQASSCEHDCFVPVSPDICSYDVRKYMQCLRSLFVQCSRAPYTEFSKTSGQMNAQLYDDLQERLFLVTTVAQMEQVYNDYMTGCLVHET